MSAEEYIYHDLYASEDFHEESKKAVFSSLYPLNSLSASVAVAELMKYLTGMQCSLKNQVIAINGQDFNTQTHYIYKDYQCPVCVKKDVVSR